MFGKDRRPPAAALAGGLVALLALVGCGGDRIVASKSAASAAEGMQGHGGHAGMHHGQSGALPPQTPPAGGQPSGGGHAGHSPSPGDMPPGTAAPESTAVSSGQPAATLRPDALDAPAATSMLDAQRSAEMAEEMAGASGGGHEDHGGDGGHGGGTYRHVDAGRGPEAQEGPHQHHGHGMAQEEGAVYACPMHPEVTSTAPGKCPKCGMTLVKRRKE